MIEHVSAAVADQGSMTVNRCAFRFVGSTTDWNWNQSSSAGPSTGSAVGGSSSSQSTAPEYDAAAPAFG